MIQVQIHVQTQSLKWMVLPTRRSCCCFRCCKVASTLPSSLDDQRPLQHPTGNIDLIVLVALAWLFLLVDSRIEQSNVPLAVLLIR